MSDSGFNLGSFVNEFLGAHQQAGPQQVEQTATDHLAAADPQNFQQSAQQGVSSIDDQQVGGWAQKIMGALQNTGIPTGQVAQQAGLSTAAPQEMTKGDLSGLLGYVQQYAPAVLGQLLAREPALSQLLGGSVVQGLLGKLTG